VQKLLKNLLDRAAALALLTTLAPVILVIAAAVKLSQGGPLLYRELRLERGGRPFAILKFRSLDSAGGSSVAPDNDPRILPLARHLRRWRLDEIPTLVNVLMGHMSLVGPRPLSLPHSRRVAPEILAQLVSVRPGITGPAALAFIADDLVLGDYAEPESLYFEYILPAKVEMELDYLAHWSLLVDLKLLGLTLLQFWSPGARERSEQRVRSLLAERVVPETAAVVSVAGDD
jgi:lipopolysaccharide/colanic/teichoic acid biosynthesis glycosyltransferase